MLERMNEVEAVTLPEDQSKRPEEHLLVSSHVTDVIPPETYLGNDVQFVDFVQARANVCAPHVNGLLMRMWAQTSTVSLACVTNLGASWFNHHSHSMAQEIVKRQARMLDQLAKEDISERPSGADIESEIYKAVEVVFSCPEQSSQAMERPGVLQEDDGVKVVKAVAQNPDEGDVRGNTQSIAAGLDDRHAGDSSGPRPGSRIAWMNSESVAPEQPADVSYEHDDRYPTGLVQSGKRPDCPAFHVGSTKEGGLPGMRRKRTLEGVQKEESASAGGHHDNDNASLKGTTSVSTWTPYTGANGTPAPFTDATGDNGTQYEAAADKALPEAHLPVMHTEFRSGVRVQKHDAFVLWSSHIRQCDEDEQREHANNQRAQSIGRSAI